MSHVHPRSTRTYAWITSILAGTCLVSVAACRSVYWSAAENGNCRTVSLLASICPMLVHAVDSYGDTALNHAVERGDVRMVECLAALGADMDHEGGRIGRPLQFAAFYDSPEMVSAVIEGGASIDLGDFHESSPIGEPAIICAAAAGRADNLKVLLDHGASIGVRSGARANCTALHAVTAPVPLSNDRVRCIELLLEHGASPDVVDDDGETPLDWARRYAKRCTECQEVVQVLEKIAAR